MKTVSGRIGDEIILSQLERREDALQDASNTIDNKASQLFAAGALLAVQPGVLLIQDLTRWVIWVQAASCICLFVVFYFAHDTLKVREYPAPLATDEWRDATVAPAGTEAEEDGPGLLIWSLIVGIRARIKRLEDINDSRLRTLAWGRRALIAALVLNFVALAGLAVRSLSSKGRSAPVAVSGIPSGEANPGTSAHCPASAPARAEPASVPGKVSQPLAPPQQQKSR